MTDEFEDPRKTALRRRAEQAADAAGYTVDSDRPPLPFPQAADLEGAIRPDVLALGTDGVTRLLFVRVEGDKPIPGWISNYVRISVDLNNVEVYVVVEDVGEHLHGSCASAGAGLLRLAGDNTLEQILDYGPPDASAAKRAFVKRVRDIRRRLDTKANLNLANLEKIFQESYGVTAPMKKNQRDEYLRSIEAASVAWRTWLEELSDRVDQADADGDEAALDAIEAEIVSFDIDNNATAA